MEDNVVLLIHRDCHGSGQPVQVVGRVWMGMGLGRTFATHLKPLPHLWVHQENYILVFAPYCILLHLNTFSLRDDKMKYFMISFSALFFM